ncbi:MAG: CBS domain-containing protein [Gemmataceae bacterium]
MPAIHTPDSARSLLIMTAADLMTSPVVTIPQEMSLREAARMLTRLRISGAPVVDPVGRCVGVLSSTDFVSCALEGQTPPAVLKTHFIAPWGEFVDIEQTGAGEISRYMTASPVMVPPDTPLGVVAEKMVDAHIHRVLVVDHDRPIGIITSTDVLAAVANIARRVRWEDEEADDIQRMSGKMGGPTPR